jgi:hypothetical protein
MYLLLELSLLVSDRLVKVGLGIDRLPALLWSSFARFGGLATVWLLAPTLGGWLGLEGGEAATSGLKVTLLAWGVSLVLFLPGAVVRERSGRFRCGR